MADQGELMGIFSNLVSTKKPVTMYNTYHGLPFVCDADILALDQGKVTTKVLSYQAVSMAMEGRTYLRSSSLPETILANVVEVDFKKKQAVLSSFSGAGYAVGKRVLARVQPGNSLEAVIYDGRQRIRGTIADISVDGMCIFTFFAFLYGQNFRNNKEVFINFKTPCTETVVRVKGIITNLTGDEGSYLHRMGLKIYPSPEIKPLLEDYIAHRQAELIDELEQTYLSMRGKKIQARMKNVA